MIVSDTPRRINMTFPRRKMRLFCCVLSALLTVIALVVVQVVNTPTAHAATNQFHGVNWADPNDNFITGPTGPSRLSTVGQLLDHLHEGHGDPQGLPEPGSQHGAAAVQRGDHVVDRGGTATRRPWTRPPRWA